MRIGKIFAAAIVAATTFGAVAQTSIENLRVCRMVEPSDIVKPVFSWQMRTERQGAAQTAYAIELRTEDGREVWRSGRVKDAHSHATAYTGPVLKSATRYAWSVVVTDERGREISSKPATFETGLVAADDW